MTLFSLARDHFLTKHGLDNWSGARPMAIAALPAVGYAIAKRTMPPEAWLGGLAYASVWHIYTHHMVVMPNLGWKGAPTFQQR